MSTKRDGEFLYKKWLDGRGMVLEDEALLSIFLAYDADPAADQFEVVCAVRNAMLAAWEAGWDAAGGDDE